MTRRKTLRTLFLAAVATVGFARSSHAALLVDLRLTGVSGPAVIEDLAPPRVLVTGIGARIDMEIWAIVVATNSTTLDDGLLDLSGSLVSGPGDNHLKGIMTAELLPAFSGPGSTAGRQQDLDGDGDLDVGGTNDADPTDFFVARAATAPNPVAGTNIRIGRASFTVQDVTSGFGFTQLEFFSRINPAAATWFADGVMRTPGTDAFSGFRTVAVSAIPEPAALGLLAAVTTFAAALRPQKKH